jgi:hypothetical protein
MDPSFVVVSTRNIRGSLARLGDALPVMSCHASRVPLLPWYVMVSGTRKEDSDTKKIRLGMKKEPAERTYLPLYRPSCIKRVETAKHGKKVTAHPVDYRIY